MCAMQGSSGQDEQLSPELAEVSQGTQGKTINWTLVAAASLYIAWSFYLTLQDDEARLYFLNQVVKLLHNITRLLGALAIRTEKAYYNYANTLHD